MTSIINGGTTAVQQINRLIAQGGVKAGELVMLCAKPRPRAHRTSIIVDYAQQQILSGDKALYLCMESTQ